MSVPLRANENTFERAELLDAATGPADDRAQGVVGHSNRNPELMAHAFVQPAQQCPSTGQHDASVEDVAGELGRAHIQRGPDQLDDLQHRSLDRAAHFWRGDGDRVGQPGREVASCDPDAELLPQGERRAGADLDVLGASLTQQEGVLALDVADDRLVDLVATQA